MNNTKWSPTTVARIYRQRWDIQMLFKRIKQNLPPARLSGETRPTPSRSDLVRFSSTSAGDDVLYRAPIRPAHRWYFSV
ncbi:MAG: hypothetical protein IPP83_12665 [Flavobacteriales bacterium]|nr:hypothetical protein [Flavobacteriales bacterium]